MKMGTQVEMEMINSLSEAMARVDKSISSTRHIKDILEDLLSITDDQHKLANAQIEEENHLHSLSSKKGINFRE